jgi:hypothetical protein
MRRVRRNDLREEHGKYSTEMNTSEREERDVSCEKRFPRIHTLSLLGGHVCSSRLSSSIPAFRWPEVKAVKGDNNHKTDFLLDNLLYQSESFI